MMIHIIPWRRIVRGKETFRYAAPVTLPYLRPGTLVTIPFREARLLGLCEKISGDHVAGLREIITVWPKAFWFSNERLAFLKWFAQYYGISLPHAFRTLQHPFLDTASSLDARDQLSNHSPLAPDHPTAISPFSAHLLRQKELLLHYSHRADVVNALHHLTKTVDGHIVIIAPTYHDVRFLADHLPNDNNRHRRLAFTEEPSPRQLSALAHAMQQSSPLLILGTKKLLFLQPEKLSLLIITDEEDRSHKQYDQNPRFHTRTVACHLQKFFSRTMRVVYTSVAPSIDLFSRHDVPRLDLRRSWDDRQITVVDMEDEKKRGVMGWFSETLQTRIAQAERIILFLNRTGTARFAVCPDCAKLSPPETTICPTCGCTRLFLRGKGVTRLAQEVRMLFPDRNILQIDRSMAAVSAKEFQRAHIIIGTEKIFSQYPDTRVDLIGILSVDHLLVYPHWQSHERVFQLLVKIFTLHRPTILQTHAPQHPVLRAAVTNGYEHFAVKELQTRKQLGLPPFQELTMLRDRRKKTTTLHRGPLDPRKLPPHILLDRAA